jgi:hypothetical protein
VASTLTGGPMGHANFATTLSFSGGITSEALDNAGGKIAEAFKKAGQMVQSESRSRG